MQAEIERATRLVRYPEDWRDTTLESVAEINPESLGTQTPTAFQFRYIDIASVTSGLIDWSSVKTHHFVTAPSRARRVVRPGDVLLSTVRPGLQAHAYADWSQQDGYICSTGFAVLRSGRAIWPRFLYHLVFSDIVTSQVRRLEVGSNYPAITETDVRWLRIPQPPLPEQRRIAEILDTADRAIGETEALIPKLKRIKTGLMHDLLTRGLDERGQLRDPDARPEQFKDSPLGRIPREWEVTKVADIAGDVTDGDHHTPERSSEGVFLLSARNILNGRLALDDVDFVPEHEYQRMIRRCYPEPGDILISCSGTIGRVCEVPAGLRCALVRSAALIKLQSRCCQSRFAEWVLQSSFVQRQIHKEQLQAAQPNLFQGSIRRLLVPLPSLSEQHRIAEILDAHDARIRAEEAYRDKLKLQKKGLMEDLLTGRVRVKTAQEVGA